MIPKVISGMVVFRSLSSYFEHKNVDIITFIWPLCVYICCTICFFYVSFMVSADLYALCSMSSLLLLEMWFFKQKTTYKKILCYLFSAWPLSIIMMIVLIFVGFTLRDIFHVENRNFFPFYRIVCCLLVLIVCTMYFTTKINGSRFKSIANVCILVMLSALSVVAVVILPMFILLN